MMSMFHALDFLLTLLDLCLEINISAYLVRWLVSILASISWAVPFG